MSTWITPDELQAAILCFQSIISQLQKCFMDYESARRCKHNDWNYIFGVNCSFDCYTETLCMMLVCALDQDYIHVDVTIIQTN